MIKYMKNERKEMQRGDERKIQEGATICNIVVAGCAFFAFCLFFGN